LASANPVDHDGGQADDVRAHAVGPMLQQVAAAGTEDAVALLRVMTVLGAPKLREQANAHPRQLVGAGLSDRPWVRILGRPTLLRVCRFAAPGPGTGDGPARGGELLRSRMDGSAGRPGRHPITSHSAAPRRVERE